MFIVNSMMTLTTSGVIMLPLLKQSKTKLKLFFERIIKRMGSVKCDKTLNVPISYKGKGNGSSKYECELAVAYETTTI